MVLRIIILACLYMIVLAAYTDGVIDTGVYLSFTVDMIIAWLLVEVVIELKK